jgi:hypothetical protein
MLLVLPFAGWVLVCLLGSFLLWTLVLPGLLAIRFSIIIGLVLVVIFCMTTDENGDIVEDESETNES